MPTATHFLSAAGYGRVGQQCHLARAFDGHGELTLMTSAGTGYAPGLDLAPLTHEATKHFHVLVVDLLNLLPAQRAVAAAGQVEGATLSGRTRFGSGFRHSYPLV